MGGDGLQKLCGDPWVVLNLFCYNRWGFNMQGHALGMGNIVQFLSASVIYIVQLLKAYTFFPAANFQPQYDDTVFQFAFTV